MTIGTQERGGNPVQLAPLKALRILIIDDFAHMRSSLRAMLRELGAEDPMTAANGDDALVLLSTHDFDVVLCDYNLGDGKDGQQILEETRHRHLLRYSAAFVMITAETTMPMVLGAIEHQPDDYLAKPFVRDVLRLRLQRTVARRRGFDVLDQPLADGDSLRALELCDRLSGGGDPRRALDLLKLKAELHLSIGEHRQAEALYAQALQTHDFPWARFGIGRAYVQQGRDDEARTVFEGLIERDAHYVAAYDGLAAIHERQQRFDQAQDVLRAAVEWSPKSVRRQRALGRVAERNGDLETATSAFQAAIRQGRHSCFAGSTEYARLASLLSRQGLSKKALQVLREGRIVFDGHPSQQLDIAAASAEVMRERGMADEAGAVLQEALKLHERHPESLCLETAIDLARQCFAAGLTEAGEALMRRMVCNAHDDAEALGAIRRLFEEFGLTQQGEALIEAGRAEMVKVNNEGVSLFKQGRAQEAMALLLKAADGMPLNRTTNLNAVRVLLHHMRNTGTDPGLLFRASRYIERLRRHDGMRAECEKMLGALHRLRNARAAH